MSFQPCPICMGTGTNVGQMQSACPVCKGKRIISTNTGLPPEDAGCGPSFCENCGCGKKDAALKKQKFMEAIKNFPKEVRPYSGKMFKKGQEIRFVAAVGEQADIAEAKAVLKVGDTYKVKTCTSSGWFNDVELEGFDFLLFNSVMFEEVQNE